MNITKTQYLYHCIISYELAKLQLEVSTIIAFIRNYQIESLKKKMILLYILNVTDIILTWVLLTTGFFKEVNVFMVNAVESPTLSIVLKVILPALLLLYLYKRNDVEDISGLRSTNIGINISLGLYTIVNITHFVWIAMLPFLYHNHY